MIGLEIRGAGLVSGTLSSVGGTVTSSSIANAGGALSVTNAVVRYTDALLGSDTNDGMDSRRPFATLNKMFNSTTNLTNITYYIAPGIYAETNELVMATNGVIYGYGVTINFYGQIQTNGPTIVLADNAKVFGLNFKAMLRDTNWQYQYFFGGLTNGEVNLLNPRGWTNAIIRDVSWDGTSDGFIVNGGLNSDTETTFWNCSVISQWDNFIVDHQDTRHHTLRLFNNKIICSGGSPRSTNTAQLENAFASLTGFTTLEAIGNSITVTNETNVYGINWQANSGTARVEGNTFNVVGNGGANIWELSVTGSGIMTANPSQLSSAAKLNDLVGISWTGQNAFLQTVNCPLGTLSVVDDFGGAMFSYSGGHLIGDGGGLINLLNSYTSYAVGTAYSLTATPAQLTFGTTSPGVTITTAGTYLIQASANIKYNGATYAANQTATLKLRRTNNTAADIANSSRTSTLRVITTITDNVGVLPLPEVVYTATAGDIIQLWGSVSATPAAGSVQTDSAEIIITRLR